jgi:lipopolysaccharide export system protein LptC
MSTATFAPAARRARAFDAARRHSAHVWLLRRGLEACVVLALAGGAILTLYRNFAPRLPGVAFEGIGIEGGRITMDKPRLTGQRPDGRSYAITAVKAMQDAQHPGDVELAIVGGDIIMPDRGTSRISAGSGHYDGAAETLDLAGGVRLVNARYEVDLRSVRIAFKSGDYVSTEPVTVRILPDATITADSFSALQNGARAHFEGHVRTLVQGRAAAIAGSAP